MDPFDEFEFKPLTEGLGFHTRAQSNLPARPANDFNLEFMAPDFTPATTQIQNALPRNEEISQPLVRENNSTIKVDEILKTLGKRKRYDFSESTPKHIPSWTASKPEIAATLLDGMLIFAGFLASMISLLMITKIDLFGNLMIPDSEGLIYAGLAGLLASVAWIYLVTNRIFLGYTPGEWVFDQRLGLPAQMGSASYTGKVALRSLIVIATGIVVVPFLSFVLRQDILGRALGLQLMKKV